MPNPLAGTSYKEFLKKQIEADPPTPEQMVWAKENFSSRADPPTTTPIPTPTEE